MAEVFYRVKKDGQKDEDDWQVKSTPEFDAFAVASGMMSPEEASERETLRALARQKLAAKSLVVSSSETTEMYSVMVGLLFKDSDFTWRSSNNIDRCLEVLELLQSALTAFVVPYVHVYIKNNETGDITDYVEGPGLLVDRECTQSAADAGFISDFVVKFSAEWTGFEPRTWAGYALNRQTATEATITAYQFFCSIQAPWREIWYEETGDAEHTRHGLLTMSECPAAAPELGTSVLPDASSETSTPTAAPDADIPPMPTREQQPTLARADSEDELERHTEWMQHIGTPGDAIEHNALCDAVKGPDGEYPATLEDVNEALKHLSMRKAN